MVGQGSDKGLTASNMGHVDGGSARAAHTLRDISEVLEQLHVLVPWLAMLHLVKACDLHTQPAA